MASIKRSRASLITKTSDEISQPVQVNIAEPASLAEDITETENSRLQRLLTIMELLGKLVEKEGLIPPIITQFRHAWRN